MSFARDDDELRIGAPGKIYFCANDEVTKPGTDRMRELMNEKQAEYKDSILIESPIKGVGVGYLDNVGIIRVRIAVKSVAKK